MDSKVNGKKIQKGREEMAVLWEGLGSRRTLYTNCIIIIFPWINNKTKPFHELFTGFFRIYGKIAWKLLFYNWRKVRKIAYRECRLCCDPCVGRLPCGGGPPSKCDWWNWRKERSTYPRHFPGERNLLAQRWIILLFFFFSIRKGYFLSLIWYFLSDF